MLMIKKKKNMYEALYESHNENNNRNIFNAL